ISDDTHCTSGADHIIRQDLNGPIIANGDQANAIFYFSIGERAQNAQNDNSHLESLEGVTPVESHIVDGTYPLGYFLSDVYCNDATAAGSHCPVKAPAPVNKYLNPSTGWLCKQQAKHAKDPATGDNFQTEIAATIRSLGMAPLPLAPTGSAFL